MALSRMEWKEWATFGIAALGAALGVFNFVKTVARERVRLALSTHLQVAPRGDRSISLRVVNLSAFPVTVTVVGFALDRGEFGFDAALCRDLPQRLEPRAALAASVPLAIADEADWFFRVRGVYAATACGVQTRRPSKWLRSLAKEARPAAQA